MAQEPLSPEAFTTFGELLKHLRRQARLTQRELGSAVGYSFTTISKLEMNERLPDVSVVRARFIEALGLRVERQSALAARLLELAQASHSQASTAATKSRNDELMPLVGRSAEWHALRDSLSRAGAGG